MKNVTAVIGALILGAGIALAGITSASATGNAGPCVSSDAVYRDVVTQEAGWQRYSYTGSWGHDVAPPFPSNNWQANVAGDPHGVGAEGAYYRSHGNSGWFYLQAIPRVVESQLVTPAVVCDDVPEPADGGSSVEPTTPAVPPIVVQPDSLANTGVSGVTGWLVPVAFGLSLLGGAGLLLGRRRMFVGR